MKIDKLEPGRSSDFPSRDAIALEIFERVVTDIWVHGDPEDDNDDVSGCAKFAYYAADQFLTEIRRQNQGPQQ